MNSWINLRGARNNLYIITYVINLKKKSQNQGGGGVQPSLIYLL